MVLNWYVVFFVVRVRICVLCCTGVVCSVFYGILWDVGFLCTQRHTLTCIFSALYFSDAHLTPCAHFSTLMVQSRIEKSFHQVIRRLVIRRLLALLDCDGCHCHNHDLTSLHRRRICAITRATCLVVWHYSKHTQVMSPTSLSALLTVR